MTDSLQDCLARAAQARAAAEAEPLPNVQQKHLASAKVWEALAVKARRLAERRFTRIEAMRLLQGRRP